jgi:nitric oxide reductase NorQ protein
MHSGMGIPQAIEAAIIEPLSDDADVQDALRDLVATVYG